MDRPKCRSSDDDQRQTCQCTQCRKWTGAVIIHLISIPKAEVEWTTKGTLKEFESSPGNYRGFCHRCGSSLYWRSDKASRDEFEMAASTLDYEHLREDEAKELFTPVNGRCWCSREIKGVTSPDGFYGGGPARKETGLRFVEATGKGDLMP